MSKEGEALEEIAGMLEEVVREIGLERADIRKIYLLRELESDLKEIVNEKYKDVPDAVFFLHFYVNFRHHLWKHIAAHASLRVTDEETENILRKVVIGLRELAEGMKVYSKEKMYDGLVTLISGYVQGLDEEVDGR